MSIAELQVAEFKDRVRDWTRSEGSGPFVVLDESPAGYSSFSSFTDGVSLYYCIVDTQGRWATYRGVWTESALSLSVAEFISSSTGAVIEWDADLKQIFSTFIAENYRDLVDAVSTIVTDHGFLTGLGDDDHPQYHNDARALTWLGTRSTSDLPEGVRLYFTDERVDDRVAALIQNGTGITWSYNDVANTLTPTVTITQYTDEMAQDAVGTILVDGTTIDFTYNDAANTITAERAALTGDVTASAGSNATTIANNAVSDAKLRDSAAVSVIGRSANSSGDPADIAAGANDRILRRVSNALDFGQLTVGMFPDSVVTLAKIANAAANSKLLGSGSAGSGAAYSELTLGTNLSMSGTTLNATGGTNKVAILQHQTTDGTSGGTATSGSWEDRPITTELSDVDAIVSISGNAFTPISGTYIVRVTTSHCVTNGTRVRLFNSTSAAAVQLGRNAGATSRITDTNIFGPFSANGTDAYKIQQQVQTTRATDGFGEHDSITAGVEVHLNLELHKIA